MGRAAAVATVCEHGISRYGRLVTIRLPSIQPFPVLGNHCGKLRHHPLFPGVPSFVKNMLSAIRSCVRGSSQASGKLPIWTFAVRHLLSFVTERALRVPHKILVILSALILSVSRGPSRQLAFRRPLLEHLGYHTQRRLI
jgi:hypothetical protein